MNELSVVLLMEPDQAELVKSMFMNIGVLGRFNYASNLSQLKMLSQYSCNLLLSFGTGVIVPGKVLDKFDFKLNIHPASPSYPGRDPHHFAIYDGVTEYGATLHFMTPKVDAGEIIDVEFFSVKNDATPAQLLDQANKAAFCLMARLIEQIHMFGLDSLSSNPGFQWGARKTSRKDFLALCEVDARMSEQEFERRLNATTMPGYNNLVIKLFGHTFRIEGNE